MEWRGPEPPRTALEHVRLRIDEAKYFIELMRTRQSQWQYNVKRRKKEFAKRDREEFLYCLHAFLSACRITRYYLHRAVKGNPERVKWLKSRTAGIVFNVFDDLRNFATHAENIRLSTAYDISGKKEISGQDIRQSIGPLNVQLDIGSFEVQGDPAIALDVTNLPASVRRNFAIYSQDRKDGTKVLVICDDYLDELEQTVNFGVAHGYL